MTKPAWTPGPWDVACAYAESNVYRLWDMEGNYPADCSADAMNANALLIAAAPELFEALNAIVCAGGEWARQEVDHDNTPADEALLNALRDARAALRKATGEQQ